MQSVVELALATNFSGVVRVDAPGYAPFTRAFGFADRRHGITNRVETRFGIASGTKGLTALAVMSVIESGLLSLATPARAVLGNDLPLADDSVSIEHLLAHRSGIGDYLDESELNDVNEHVMAVPVHRLATTADYIQIEEAKTDAGLAGIELRRAAGRGLDNCRGEAGPPQMFIPARVFYRFVFQFMQSAD